MQDIEFEKTVKEYGRKLYGYLLKFLSNPEDAEDILQSTFTAFYNNMPAINSAKYSSYLFRTAHNKAINYLKKEKRYTRYNEFSDEQHTLPTEENPEIAKLQDAMKRLKPKELLVLELQMYQDMDYKQIAETLETTVSAIDSILVRAKRKLRSFLQENRE
jgi:RNA polymerase sigma-70 factor, ECF subfamily